MQHFASKSIWNCLATILTLVNEEEEEGKEKEKKNVKSVKSVVLFIDKYTTRWHYGLGSASELTFFALHSTVSVLQSITVGWLFLAAIFIVSVDENKKKT